MAGRLIAAPAGQQAKGRGPKHATLQLHGHSAPVERALTGHTNYLDMIMEQRSRRASQETGNLRILINEHAKVLRETIASRQEMAHDEGFDNSCKTDSTLVAAHPQESCARSGYAYTEESAEAFSMDRSYFYEEDSQPQPVRLVHRHHHHHYHHHYYWPDQEVNAKLSPMLADESEYKEADVGAAAHNGERCQNGEDHRHFHLHQHFAEVGLPLQARRLLYKAQPPNKGKRDALSQFATVDTTLPRLS